MHLNTPKHMNLMGEFRQQLRNGGVPAGKTYCEAKVRTMWRLTTQGVAFTQVASFDPEVAAAAKAWLYGVLGPLDIQDASGQPPPPGLAPAAPPPPPAGAATSGAPPPPPGHVSWQRTPPPPLAAPADAALAIEDRWNGPVGRGGSWQRTPSGYGSSTQDPLWLACTAFNVCSLCIAKDPGTGWRRTEAGPKHSYLFKQGVLKSVSETLFLPCASGMTHELSVRCLDCGHIQIVQCDACEHRGAPDQRRGVEIWEDATDGWTQV